MTAAFDDAFRTTVRLKIAAFLSGCDEAEFRAVQAYCDLSASALSKHAAALEGTGHLAIRKGHVGKTPRTWLSLSPYGRQSLAGHLDALREIADAATRHGRTASPGVGEISADEIADRKLFLVNGLTWD